MQNKQTSNMAKGNIKDQNSQARFKQDSSRTQARKKDLDFDKE